MILLVRSTFVNCSTNLIILDPDKNRNLLFVLLVCVLHTLKIYEQHFKHVKVGIFKNIACVQSKSH